MLVEAPKGVEIPHLFHHRPQPRFLRSITNQLTESPDHQMLKELKCCIVVTISMTRDKGELSQMATGLHTVEPLTVDFPIIMTQV